MKMTQLAVLLALTLSPSIAGAEKIFTNGFETVNPCDDGNNRVQPFVLGEVLRDWVPAWSSTNGRFVAAFPNSPPAPIALGSNLGQYLSVRFTYPPNAVWQISFDQAQPNSGYGYGQPRPTNGAMFIGFSQCRGDFRATDNSSEHWWLHQACRRINTADTITLTTRTDLQAHICYVPAGVEWYMTVAPLNPNAVNWLDETCLPPTHNQLGQGCDVQAVHRGL